MWSVSSSSTFPEVRQDGSCLVTWCPCVREEQEHVIRRLRALEPRPADMSRILSDSSHLCLSILCLSHLLTWSHWRDLSNLDINSTINYNILSLIWFLVSIISQVKGEEEEGAWSKLLLLFLILVSVASFSSIIILWLDQIEWCISRK